MSRETTHVHVIPLCAPGGIVHGMVMLEASCKTTMDQAFIWEICYRQLDWLASVSAPYLGALPLCQTEAVSADELLPVIGPSTAGLIELVRLFAQQEETILIRGPTGVGKSKLARFCHAHSRRCLQRFETLDLLSVPEDLQMAELFGWRKGAFTSAVKDTAGAITRAARGTLFIDEIDKLSMKAQAGLLRVLEERRYRPLGDESSDRRADVRFIVSTNGDLRAAVRAGRFREDLYYRINVLPVRLPALAERLDELPFWADYMLNRRHCEAGHSEKARLAPGAIELLSVTPWPGNLRQLDNILRRAYTLAQQDIVNGVVVLERRHIQGALSYDDFAEGDSMIACMWRAARAFVNEAERREEGGVPLSLELCEAFRGMVLGAAVQRRGNREQAFVMMGQQHLLRNRNHHRALHRELDRVRELLRVVGGEVDPDLAALANTPDDLVSG